MKYKSFAGAPAVHEQYTHQCWFGRPSLEWTQAREIIYDLHECGDAATLTCLHVGYSSAPVQASSIHASGTATY